MGLEVQSRGWGDFLNPSVKTDGNTFYLSSNILLNYYKCIAVDLKSREIRLNIHNCLDAKYILFGR
jgi:hypothetical protein